ncbi:MULTISPECIES: response regulator transcription factor [Microbulbifer]|uniref:Response regulator transcription factor n=1 Tax=Microbulbifer celer TaxID=435905 RepID=A0ABW3U5B0_9GAMM|nr:MULTISPECIES: helix-turn-helix transcriptional regulator [Microbulbifer]UFN56546.1 helix-turn-helix transcriptional regulator [Microbulbifer celer]
MLGLGWGAVATAARDGVDLHFALESARKRYLGTGVYQMSDRERQVVRLMAEGATSEEIADRLYLSVHTVKNHRKNILRKTGCRNSGQLVSRCIAAKIL